MSGGHFNYDQYRISQIAEQIRTLIANNDSDETDEWGNPRGLHYTPETIARFQFAVDTLDVAYVYVQRIDWLVSGDDSEKTFMQRLDEDMEKILSNKLLEDTK